jgi:YD repeat-containing protein
LAGEVVAYQSGNLISSVISRDSVGNITTIDDVASGLGTAHLSYDSLYRLTDATGDGYEAQTWTYDNAGNRTSAAVGVNEHGVP